MRGALWGLVCSDYVVGILFDCGFFTFCLFGFLLGVFFNIVFGFFLSSFFYFRKERKSLGIVGHNILAGRNQLTVLHRYLLGYRPGI